MQSRRETLVLTLPHDPQLAGITRRVTLHFLVQNGVAAGAARRGARLVERRCHLLLGSTARLEAPPLVLTLSSGAEILEVSGRKGSAKARSRLVRLRRRTGS
ncbi:MAG: hypothetical protein DMF50_03350 [Acidobacteria bacterium]|nr:MAG: hypothetical protein DMF50_03350 [Acidobacteriota bacterium]